MDRFTQDSRIGISIEIGIFQLHFNFRFQCFAIRNIWKMRCWTLRPSRQQLNPFNSLYLQLYRTTVAILRSLSHENSCNHRCGVTPWKCEICLRFNYSWQIRISGSGEEVRLDFARRKINVINYTVISRLKFWILSSLCAVYYR